MSTVKKIFSSILAFALIISVFGMMSVFASDDIAVYSQGSMDFSGSAIIKGDAIITAGSLTLGYNACSTGHIYAAAAVSIGTLYPPNQSVVKDYSGPIRHYSFLDYSRFPETTYFMNKQTEYKDGTKDLVLGWDPNAGEKPGGYAITEDSFIRYLKVSYTLTLNIDVPAGEIRIIRVERLNMQGNIVIRGQGKVILYVDRMENCATGKFNADSDSFGDPSDLTLVVENGSESYSLESAKLSANFIFLGDNLLLSNTQLKGNLYAKGDVTASGIAAAANGLVFAPDSHTYVQMSAHIKGMLITKQLTISGSSYVEKGAISALPSDVAQQIGDRNDEQVFGDNGGSGTTQSSSATTQPSGTTPSTQPTSSTTVPIGNDPGGNNGQTVQITVTVARRMSIRLEDGTILKNGDKFTMSKYGTVRFQMCTNNWDTDTYTDDGQGIAGQKVFEFTHQKNKERVLRVDNLRHFMPVRFHFVKGDYKKLTGVDNVLSTPLESLSINFPLGATVTVKAYVKNKLVETQNIFIDSNLEWHNWNY